MPRRVNLAKHYSSNNEKKAEVTTLMVRNVPNQYHRGHFMEELDKLGFEDRYDFVYLPIDRQTQWNVGYAFVNFDQPEDAQRCMKVMSGHKFTRLHPGQQMRHAQVSVAHLQGLEENLAHFQNTAVFSSCSDQLQPWVRPSAAWDTRYGHEEQWQDWEEQWCEGPPGLDGDTLQHFKGYEECWIGAEWQVESQELGVQVMQSMAEGEQAMLPNPDLALWQPMGMCDNVGMAPMVAYAVVYVPAEMAAQMAQVPADMSQAYDNCPAPTPANEPDAIAELEDETPVLRKTNSLPNLELSCFSPMPDKAKPPPSTTSTASGDEALPERRIEASFSPMTMSEEEDSEASP